LEKTQRTFSKPWKNCKHHLPGNGSQGVEPRLLEVLQPKKCCPVFNATGLKWRSAPHLPRAHRHQQPPDLLPHQTVRALLRIIATHAFPSLGK